MRSRSLSRLFQRHLRPPRAASGDWPPLPEDLRLEGETIWLRWPRYSDAEAVFAYASDDRVSAYMDWNSHQGLEDSHRFLHSIDQSRAAGREAAFGIIERATDEFIGICSLVSQKDPRRAEMGYASRRSAWGRGYMTEAVRLIVPWAFHALLLHEIFAEVHPSNVASQRVLEKSGFLRQDAPVRRSIKGVVIPHLHYYVIGDPM